MVIWSVFETIILTRLTHVCITDAQTRQAGTENTDPLPNPWAPRTSTTSTSSTTSTTATTTTTANTPNNTAGGLWGTPGMQSYMQQISQNPRLMESIINTPYMQTITQSLATNPELTHQIMSNNPLLQSNPELREQLMRTMPTLLQQLQNPEMQSLLSNPEALQAVLQIQEGMQRLQSTAPGLLTGYKKFEILDLLKFFQLAFNLKPWLSELCSKCHWFNNHNNLIDNGWQHVFVKRNQAIT
jgi:hypothetical protein